MIKKTESRGLWMVFCFVFIILSCSTEEDYIIEIQGPVIEDLENFPVTWSLEGKSDWNGILEQKSVFLIEIPTKTQHSVDSEIPAQLQWNEQKQKYFLTALIPNSFQKERRFKLVFKNKPPAQIMHLESDAKGQPIIKENLQKVLQYNYETVYEEDVVRPEGEVVKMVYDKMSGPYYEAFLESHPNYPSDTVVTSSIYSVPRSNYIHPLYGLDEELLTRDWPDGGHPHHRGIFWAWPEVIYGDQMGDIYALQRVFARPTGQIELLEGPVYAQIEAENVWMWDEKLPIVREKAEIRAYRAGENERIIDLSLELLALEEDITIATRFTNSYGGLNVRMETPDEQDISYHVDESDKGFRKAWADFNGTFKGRDHKSGLLILQHRSNPEYPGEWVEYPELSWIQPTFPSPGTRYPLNSTKPLKLKYRFVVHLGGEPSNQVSESYWDAYHYSDIE